MLVVEQDGKIVVLRKKKKQWKNKQSTAVADLAEAVPAPVLIDQFARQNRNDETNNRKRYCSNNQIGLFIELKTGIPVIVFLWRVFPGNDYRIRYRLDF